MQMNVKRRYLIQLKNILEHPEMIFEGNISGANCYAITLNYKTAKAEYDAVLEAFPIDEKYIEYNRKHDDYLISQGVRTQADFDKKDEDTRNAINQALNALAEEYKDTIAAGQVMDKDREEFLDQTMDVNLWTIAPSSFTLKDNGWAVWNALYNDGNGMVRE